MVARHYFAGFYAVVSSGQGLFLKGDLLSVEADGREAVGAVGPTGVVVSVGVAGGATILVVGGLDAASAVAVAVVAVDLGVEKILVGGVDFFAFGTSLAVVALQHAGADDAKAVVGIGDKHGKMVISIHHPVGGGDKASVVIAIDDGLLRPQGRQGREGQ